MTNASVLATRLPAQPNLSLINGMACLQAVAVADRPIGCRELAREFGFEHTRISRLLGTLAHLGLVERTPERKFRPGPALHLLSAMSLRGSGLLTKALPVLQTLVDPEVSLILGLLWQRQVCYLVYAGPGQDPAQAIGAHSPYPAQESVLGKVLLAAQPDAEVRNLLASGPEPMPAAPLKTLICELLGIRRQGYALQAASPDHWSMAIGIGVPPVAALAMMGAMPADRLQKRLPRLQAAAEAIAQAVRG